ncbi:hypothetical protein [Delftia acidovorans]|uniref:Transmembrane protein n=1 Tax=Delftia acidovorans TaxID=80866 RepID=A0AAJ2V838_DELAC|nr:hypothetical protein [Delftia acidovorans]MDX4955319.1 hypothetical protein [Delftia acidovorans]
MGEAESATTAAGAEVTEEAVTVAQNVTPEERHTAYYSHLLNMWGLSVFEVEKALMALSAGAIALLIALTIGKPTIFLLSLYSASLVGFVVCLLATFYVLRKHEPIALDAINSFNNDTVDVLSADYHKLSGQISFGQSVALWSFIFSVAAASMLAISLRFSSVDIKIVEEERGVIQDDGFKKEASNTRKYSKREDAKNQRELSEYSEDGSKVANKEIGADQRSCTNAN